MGTIILCLLIGLVIGVVIGIVVVKLIPVFGLKAAETKMKKAMKDAEIRAEQITRNAQLDAKTTIYEMKMEAEKEIREKKAEISESENKLLIREQSIDRRDIALSEREDALEEKKTQLSQRLADLDKKEKDLEKKNDEIIVELEKVSSMSVSEAKAELFKKVEVKMAAEVAAYIKNQEEDAKATADEAARNILSLAISKYSQEVTCDKTISVVALPSDELKGRIIGREGRNIKAIEQLTGADLIIDDTPEAITVSCFNPIRREIATKSLEALIKDGRIQPGRIEEIVEKTKNEIHATIMKTGEETLFELGLPKLNKEIVEHIGKLKYRTSYGQNALQHSKEVAYLCGIMAAELGLNQQLAKRAGLFHDIGKAVDYEVEGSHVEIGVRLAKKYGESDVVINAIASHHGDVPANNAIANLVVAADTLSAARPGARSETLENYIQRVEKLEEISKGFEGVSNAYAIQAGREIRVMVVPEKVDDVTSYKLAKDIKDKIEAELTYPGQIKVTVIREVRASETAK